uniref:Putative secreted protein salivary gland overexpressed n=1 Tax=Rhipicephalus microplus TaxID=6941 RepID=A0A6M2D9E5_RHIMP
MSVKCKGPFFFCTFVGVVVVCLWCASTSCCRAQFSQRSAGRKARSFWHVGEVPPCPACRRHPSWLPSESLVQIPARLMLCQLLFKVRKKSIELFAVSSGWKSLREVSRDSGHC